MGSGLCDISSNTIMFPESHPTFKILPTCRGIGIIGTETALLNTNLPFRHVLGAAEKQVKETYWGE